MTDLTLLTNTAHSNPVCDGNGDEFLFAKDVNVVLSDNPDLKQVFGCPCTRVGYRQRPYNDSEKAHMNKYGGSDSPYACRVWAIYEVDWTKFSGKPIAGTPLLEGGCTSPGGLSDASITAFAVHPAENRVVSYTKTSYWVEDKHDLPNWRKRLFQKYAEVTA